MDKMFDCWGLLGWPLFLADLSDVETEAKERILRGPSGEAMGLQKRLNVVSGIPSHALLLEELEQRCDSP